MPNSRHASIKLVDPRHAYPSPPFKDQKAIKLPGSSADMNPPSEHGETSYRGSGLLQDMSILITGGDSGIGRAIATCFAHEGARVAINYFGEESDAKETRRLVQQAGGELVTIAGDLQDETFCNNLVDQTISRLGSLDVLINNAAYQETRDTLAEFSTELFDRIFKTNVYAPFWLCRAALDRMTPGGSIINTVSIQGYNPSPELLPYSSSKSALIGMTKGLAKLAIEKGIRVNAVAPGPVWTPLIPATLDEKDFRAFGANTLFKRPAQPVELAPLFVWLASPQASYVTGEVFGATGGNTPV